MKQKKKRIVDLLDCCAFVQISILTTLPLYDTLKIQIFGMIRNRSISNGSKYSFRFGNQRVIFRNKTKQGCMGVRCGVWGTSEYRKYICHVVCILTWGS